MVWCDWLGRDLTSSSREIYSVIIPSSEFLNFDFLLSLFFSSTVPAVALPVTSSSPPPSSPSCQSFSCPLSVPSALLLVSLTLHSCPPLSRLKLVEGKDCFILEACFADTVFNTMAQPFSKPNEVRTVRTQHFILCVQIMWLQCITKLVNVNVCHS